MPRITAHVDDATKTAWRRLSRERGLSESALLGAVATAAANQLDKLDLSGYTNRERGGHSLKIDIRLREHEDQAVRAAAKTAGLPSRQAWVVAAVRGRLLDLPTPNEAELDALRNANRQLRMIGVNLNQIAHRVNIDDRERTALTGQTLEQLRAAVLRERDAVRVLVQSVLGKWTVREPEGDAHGSE